MRRWVYALAVTGTLATEPTKFSTAAASTALKSIASIEAVFGNAPLPSPNAPFLKEIKLLENRVSASHTHALAAIASFRRLATVGAQALQSIGAPEHALGAPAALTVNLNDVKKEYDQLFDVKKKVSALKKQYEVVAAAVKEQGILAKEAQLASTNATNAALKSKKLAESKLQSISGETKGKVQGYMTKAQEIHAAAEEAKAIALEASAFADEATSLADPAQEVAKDLEAKFLALRSQFPSIMDKLTKMQDASDQSVANVEKKPLTSVTTKKQVQFFEKDSMMGKKRFLERSATEKKNSAVKSKEPSKVVQDVNELRHLETQSIRTPEAQKTAAPLPREGKKTSTPNEAQSLTNAIRETKLKKTGKTSAIADKSQNGSALLHQKDDRHTASSSESTSSILTNKNVKEQRKKMDVIAVKERKKKHDNHEESKQKGAEEHATRKKHDNHEENKQKGVKEHATKKEHDHHKEKKQKGAEEHATTKKHGNHEENQQKGVEEDATKKKHTAISADERKKDVTRIKAEQRIKVDAKMKKMEDIQRKKNAEAGARILKKKEQMRKNNEEQTRNAASAKKDIVRKRPLSHETTKQQHNMTAHFVHPHKPTRTKVDTQKSEKPIIATKNPKLATGTSDKARAHYARSHPVYVADGEDSNAKSVANHQRTAETTVTSRDSWWSRMKNWFSPSVPLPVLVVPHFASPLKQNWLKTSRAVDHEGNHVVDLSDAFSTLVAHDEDVIATQRAREKSEALLATQDLGDDVPDIENEGYPIHVHDAFAALEKMDNKVNALLLRPDVTPIEYAMLRSVQDKSMATLEHVST